MASEFTSYWFSGILKFVLLLSFSLVYPYVLGLRTLKSREGGQGSNPYIDFKISWRGLVVRLKQ
jgi:hypothetical protein